MIDTATYTEGRWARLLRRQDAHSGYVAVAALFAALTLCVDLVFHAHMMRPWLLWTLLVVCLAVSATAVTLGTRLPRAFGAAAVVFYGLCQSYFMSREHDPQAVVAAVQQIPIVAFYLGWFIRPRIAAPLMLLSTAVFAAVMFSNPLLQPDGGIGLPVAVHALLGAILCFSAGNYLWRRTERRAHTDPLTGTLNRQGITERIGARLRWASSREPVTIVAVDFDGFKQLNDARGHAHGDAALCETVAQWRAELRSADELGRVGGDEFVLLLPRTGAIDARLIVERLQAASSHAWSWGIATARRSDIDVEHLLSLADARLYVRKRHRREVAARDESQGGQPGLPALTVAAGAVTVAEAADPKLAWGARARGAARKAIAWQTPYSALSALITLLLVTVFVTDLLAGHPHIDRGTVAFWLVMYSVATVIPLLAGRRYPHWAGIVVLVCIEGWSTYFLLYARHPHAEMNALIELPMLALYLGWFYFRRVGMTFLLLSLARNVVVVIVHPGLGHGVFNPAITVSYAILIAIFCYEGARLVRRQVRAQAIRDPLTGAFNRRGLFKRAVVVRRQAARAGRQMSLAVIDFDDFRCINETGGHAAGDAALQTAVREWLLFAGDGRRAHPGGLVGRLGGDEFVLLLVADTASSECALAERAARSREPWSWGVVPLPPDADLDSAIAQADALLYQAKRARLARA